MSIATRLMSGSLLLSGGRIVTNGLAAVSMIVLARLLTPEDFGLVAIATSVMMVLRAVTELAMSQAVIRLEEPTRDHLDTAWTLGLLRGLVIVAVMCALAWPLAQIYGDERLGPLVIVISLALLFSSLVNPRQALLLKELVFWQSVTVLIIGRLVGIAASITIAIVYQSYWALVLGTVIGEAVSMAFSYVILPYLPRFSLRSRADLLSFSVWLTLRSFVNTLN
ncbi:MAG: oligosaccharide flippase family protein, partial [Pseudomonadota bacterium]